MKIDVKRFSVVEGPFSDLLPEDSSPVKLAENKKTRIIYWYHPKDSMVYGYLNGKTTSPVFEAVVKDTDYLNAIIEMLRNDQFNKLFI